MAKRHRYAEARKDFSIYEVGFNITTNGGPWLTVPELLFEKKGLIPVLQELLASYPKPTE
ncbi:MAG TPA: hypothetical protein VMV84_03465 [Dehalococcoidales bacterium]|nr:hypothetical protein [Dehalococcoidales bacterium]